MKVKDREQKLLDDVNSLGLCTARPSGMKVRWRRKRSLA
jgi:hypothetical protein